MHYQNIVPGIFLSRPNRFTAQVMIEGIKVICHVKNTGRCLELLVPGCIVYLAHIPDALAAGRKTEYDLICVCKKLANGSTTLVNMDSLAPNQAAAEWILLGGLPGNITGLRREVSYGSSRFDLSFTMNGTPAFMEVKGVTLENNGLARFPDAPTLRGLKHMKELARAKKEGYLAYLLFVIQMKGIHSFSPNYDTQPAFGITLKTIQQEGVIILARDCTVTPDSMHIDLPVPIDLSEMSSSASVTPSAAAVVHGTSSSAGKSTG